MATQTIVYRGSDEQIFIRLYEDCNETIPVSIDDLADLEVRIMIASTVLAQYNKAGTPSPFIALTRVDEYNYYLWFECASDSETGTADIWVEAKTTDAELADSLENTIHATKGAFEIKQIPY